MLSKTLRYLVSLCFVPSTSRPVPLETVKLHVALKAFFSSLLPSRWVSLVSKNYEIERTIVQLENEISQIKQQQGEANKENIQQDF